MADLSEILHIFYHEKCGFVSHASDGTGRKERTGEESTIQSERTEAFVEDTKQRILVVGDIRLPFTISPTQTVVASILPTPAPTFLTLPTPVLPFLTLSTPVSHRPRHELLYLVRLILLLQAALYMQINGILYSPLAS